MMRDWFRQFFCKSGSHHWKEWEDADVVKDIVTGPMPAPGEQRETREIRTWQIQKRRCQLCGLLQARRVRL